MRARVALAAAAVLCGGAAVAGGDGPTCSRTLGVEVHGQHIVGDYVTGLGHHVEWPPRGQVGAAMRENRGVAVPGGPGPGFHFPNGFAAGASFCTGSNSPGPHLPCGAREAEGPPARGRGRPLGVPGAVQST